MGDNEKNENNQDIIEKFKMGEKLKSEKKIGNIEKNENKVIEK